MKNLTYGLIALLLLSAVSVGFSQLGLVNAWTGNVTITIETDGTVDPSNAPIIHSGNNYALTDNIYSDPNVQAIVIEKSGITLDGRGHTLQGQGTGSLDSSTGIFIDQTTHITIKNLKITGYFYGIWIQNSSTNTLMYNRITLNEKAIFFGGIGQSYYNQILHNRITDNRMGISNADYNTYVSYGTIAYNVFSGNEVAISLNGYRNEANSNIIKYNQITNNMDGIVLTIDPTHNVVSDNNITANTANGITLLNCYDNTIKCNTINSNGEAGIRLAAVTDNKILRNTIFKNTIGIALDSGEDTPYPTPSINNRIIGNNIGWNTQYDLQFLQSPNNLIYHNNFFSATVKVTNVESANTWDNGYPSGGNYWSAYINIDRYHGPNQNILGRDRIWDNPLIIDADNIDQYPFTRSIR